MRIERKYLKETNSVNEGKREEEAEMESSCGNGGEGQRRGSSGLAYFWMVT